MITQLFNQNCTKVLTLMSLSAGSKFNRKEIKDKTKLHNVPLDKTLIVLVNSNIIKKEKNYYFYNFESDYCKLVLEMISKQFKEFKELPLNVYYILLDISDYFGVIKGNELLLFGSYAKLIYSEKSDIDIAIIYEKDLNKKEITKFILKIEKLYEKQIELHYFEKKLFYKNKSDPLIKSIIKDGRKII